MEFGVVLQTNPPASRVVEHDQYIGRKGHGRFVKRGRSQYLV